MKSFAERLQVRRGRTRLADWKPDSTPGCKGKDQAAEQLAENLARIDELQYRLYSEARQSLLIVLQGMDSSGKDGLIRNVLTIFNPQGCKVWPFKVPTLEEAAHDFLWRIQSAAPSAGEVAVFNRSHYEDVLVVRVHELVPRRVWSLRYRAINEFERHLHEHGTRVLKFFLHISRDEQRDRLLARLDDPLKRWKFSDADLVERRHWRGYQRAYEDALTRCSTSHAPWHVIPADRKWYRDLAVSRVVADTLEQMNPRIPKARLAVQKLRARLAR
jgi:PPK2 family polyphosphate:nucleotide phosphotransferase